MNTEEKFLRSILGAFLFTGDDVLKHVQVLSGGEKSRLALARTLANPANFLILDEPSNHLDIQSIQILIESLRQHQCTMVIVSHDRHFLDQVANKIWHVDQGSVRTYQGTYSEYRWSRKHGSLSQFGSTSIEQTPAKRTTRSGGPKSKEQKRREAEARNRAYQAAKDGQTPDNTVHSDTQRAKLCKLAEASIEEAELRRAQAEAELSHPDVYSNPDSARKASENFAAIEKELSELYSRWEVLADTQSPT